MTVDSELNGRRYRVGAVLDDMAEKGWNQQELARRAGVSPMTISRFLNGGPQTPAVGKAITKALGRPKGHYLIRSTAAA